MNQLVIASSNQGKIAELAAALAGQPVEILSLRDFPPIVPPAETGDTFAANALEKALYYADNTGKPCLADDSGLEVDALGGAPGVHSARYAGPVADDGANNLKLLAALASVPSAERTARFRCVLAYALPGKGLFTAVGECAGLIGTQLCGVGGFGYDPLFVIPATGKTLAQMSLTEKGKISHRGLALKEMAIQLARYYDANRCDK